MYLDMISGKEVKIVIKTKQKLVIDIALRRITLNCLLVLQFSRTGCAVRALLLRCCRVYSCTTELEFASAIVGEKHTIVHQKQDLLHFHAEVGELGTVSQLLQFVVGQYKSTEVLVVECSLI